MNIKQVAIIITGLALFAFTIRRSSARSARTPTSRSFVSSPSHGTPGPISSAGASRGSRGNSGTARSVTTLGAFCAATLA